MVNIIVLEGIPSAGKTETIKAISSILTSRGKSFVVADDHEIASLIFDRNDITNRDSVDNVEDHILSVINKKLSDVDFLIMHNAHIFYAALNAHRNKFEKLDVEYKNIEEFFLKHNSLFVFLRIPFDRIYDHYMFSIKDRKRRNPNSRTDKFWGMKGDSDKERIDYYEKKQLTYERLLLETKIKNTTFLIDNGFEIYSGIAKKVLDYFD